MPVLDEGKVDLDAIEDALASNRIHACVLMTTCRDPVGTTMSEAEKKRLVELLARDGVPLVEEDSDGELWFSSRSPRLAKAFDALGQVLHAGTFAKTLSPACGVAWIAAGRYRVKLEQVKMSSGGLTGALNQAAVVEYLIGGGYGPHLRRLRRDLSGQSALMVEALRRALAPEARILLPPAGACSGSDCRRPSMGSSCDGALGISASAWRPVRCSPGVRGTGTSSGSGLASAGRSGRTAR